jgi:molecular chaperone DnaK (HSP70)
MDATPSGASRPATTASRERADEAVLLFPSLPVVDDSEAALKAQGIEELKQTMAVLSESIGIEHPTGTFTPLARAGTIMPVQCTQVLSTVGEGQQEIDCAILRGAGERVSDNRLIGRVRIKGIPPGKAGAPRIELKLRRQRNGDLLLSARDLASGRPLALRQLTR